MTTTPTQIDVIDSYHAHIYYDPATTKDVAAKLRQWQPRLEELLGQRGWQVTAIRVKVRSG